MSILTPHISLKRRLFSSSGWAFFTMLIWECVESLLEYAIAYVISSAITMLVIKLVATFLIITAVQTITKPTQRFIMNFVRRFTYKKGEDKVKFLKKVWDLIKSNKCTIALVISTALIGAGGTNLINVDQLPAIPFWDGEVVEAVIQEEDLIADEIVWEKEPVYAAEDTIIKDAVVATETIYGKPIFATEIVWEKEPVIADKIVWEVEPIIADEVVYLVEPVIANKLTFIANTVIYENDGTTVKYNVGDIVLNSEVGAYTDSVDVFQAGDIISEGTVLYNKGDTIREGIVKHEEGSIIEEGIIKYNIGDYIENEILYNVGDVITPAEIVKAGELLSEGTVKFNVGDVIIAKGTVLEEEKTIAGTNLTPYLYYIILAIVALITGSYFESPKDYAERKENEALKKVAKKEIKQEQKKAVDEKTQEIVEQEQKVAEAEKQKLEAERRIKIDAVKAAMLKDNNK